ncbi:MAG: acylphosphatase, partial [Acetobacteraceae bacterium]|nr:acylphosphatase [Acetobacteraceae bacterium]
SSPYRPHTGGPVNAKRLVIAGRVQGVGYRAWMAHKATQLGISGWVRNRPDGAVEALIAGDIASVEELSRLCRRGPRLAEVSSIDEDLVEAPEDPGFHQVG